ncbi:MAG: response regulator [Bacteroidetes bacterium]|nr:response regulator [Bacteroidota bacterium]
MVMDINIKSSRPARIFIVDDHQVLIDGIKLLLRKDHSIHFSKEANSSEEALELLDRCHNEIDILITDISMNGMSGLDLIEIVKKRYSHIRVIILSMYKDPEKISAIMESDAEGYVLKNSGKQELLEAIHKVYQGGNYYSPEVIGSFMRHRNAESKKQKKDIREVLTAREIEIVQLICKEMTTAEIAEKLFISPRTVDTHRKHILEKTDSRSVVSLIKLAFEHRLISIPA